MKPSQPDASATQTPLTPIWQFKPWWCQPWSILATGWGLILGSWLLAHTLWLTVLIALPLLSWMGYFLLVYPKLMRGEIERASAQGQE